MDPIRHFLMPDRMPDNFSIFQLRPTFWPSA